MATPSYSSPKPGRTPVQQAARTANIWGWSFIVTIIGAVGAGYAPPGPLRVLLLNLGILCFIIGVLELVWRHQLLRTGQARWVKILAWNQVVGTLSLLWSLYLLYQVPDSILLEYAKHSQMWIQAQPLLKAANGGLAVPDAVALKSFHITKLFCVYIVGGILILSQIWVVRHYFSLARKIAQTPSNSALPPVLK